MNNPLVKKSDLDLALARLRAEGGGGGGGGTSNYNDLSNKPSINGVTLAGNKTSSDLNIDGEENLVNDVRLAYDGSSIVVNKIANIPSARTNQIGVVFVDNQMSDLSTNPVQNNIVKSYIDGAISNIPIASSGTFGLIKAELVATNGEYKLKFTYSNGTEVFVPALYYNNDKIFTKYIHDASSSAKGVVYVDTTVNNASQNPVQNRAVKSYVDGEIQDVIDYVNSIVYLIIDDNYEDDSTEGQWRQNEQVTTTITLPLVSGYTLKELHECALFNELQSDFEILSATATQTSSNVVITIVTKCINDAFIHALLFSYELWFERNATVSADNVSFDDTNCSVIQAQEVQTAIEGLDFYLNDTMGKVLPSVTASDNGKVLTVVNGAWAKGTSSGGGVSDVTVNGVSVVTNNVAAVTVPTEASQISFDDSNCSIIQARDCQEGIETLDYQLNFHLGLLNTRVPVLSTNGTFSLTASKSQGGNPSYSWGNAFTDAYKDKLDTIEEYAMPNYGTYTYYAECSTNSSTASKTANTTNGDFEFYEGYIVCVRFTNGYDVNTNVTIDIDGSGAFPVNTTMLTDSISSNDVVFFLCVVNGGNNEYQPMLANTNARIQTATAITSTNMYPPTAAQVKQYVDSNIPSVVSTITSGGTDAVNSTAVINYINSLDATNTSY